MIQAPRVLPSNAPPLQDGDAPHHLSRLLQDASSNGQVNDYSYLNSLEQRYPASLLTGNAYTGVHHPVQVPHIYRPALRRGHSWRYGSARNYNSHEDQLRNEKIARFLYERFRSSDQYMKYRTRQHKDEKGNQKQKWPDRLELAFFQALVKWPPMGRRKLHHKEKQRGRNELIADYIEELTGEARTRKQVSSHIQVLKPFVEHDPFIMKWLSKEDFAISNSAASRALAGSAYGSGRRSSNYPVTALPDEMQGIVSSSVALQRIDLVKAKHSLDLFAPVDFSMFVQRKLDSDKVHRLHTYTQSIHDPLQADELLPDMATLSLKYPLLATMHTHRPLDCNVLLAEASLAFPTELWKDQDGANLPGVELGIAFLCASRQLPENTQVFCQNNFFKHGQNLRGDHNNSNTVSLTPAEDGRGVVETQVKFGSSFWARNLAHLATQLRTTASDPSKDIRSEVAAHIAALNAVQEIFVVTDKGPERILVVYWRFRLSTHTRGRACWQRLILPSGSTSSDYADATGGDQTQPLSARVDSVFEYPVNTYSSDAATHLSTQGNTLSVPTLQPAFEYESTSSGSALTSATWPNVTQTSFDSDAYSAPASAIDMHGDSASSQHHTNNNAYDFTDSNINISYDTSMVDFSNFDSSAFNFDVSAADAAAFAAAAAAAAADPNSLYTSNPSVTQPDWTSAYTTTTGTSSSHPANPSNNMTTTHPFSYPPTTTHSHPHSASLYNTHHTLRQDTPTSSTGPSSVPNYMHQHRRDTSDQHAQAYGGAAEVGMEKVAQHQAQHHVPHHQSHQHQHQHSGAGGGGGSAGGGHEAALAALADASYMVRGLEHA